MINSNNKKEPISYVDNDYVKSPLNNFMKRNSAHNDLFDNENKRANLNNFITFIAKVESDQRTDARNPKSSATGEFQFIDSAVDTGINRTLRNSEMSEQEWFNDFSEHRDISKLSREQQTAFFLQDFLERKGTDKVLDSILNGDTDAIKSFYYDVHHTDPDIATIKRTEKIFNDLYGNKINEEIKKKDKEELALDIVKDSSDTNSPIDYSLLELESILPIIDTVKNGISSFLNNKKEETKRLQESLDNVRDKKQKNYEIPELVDDLNKQFKSKKDIHKILSSKESVELTDFIDAEKLNDVLWKHENTVKESIEEIKELSYQLEHPEFSTELLEGLGFDSGMTFEDFSDEDLEIIIDGQIELNKAYARKSSIELFDVINEGVYNTTKSKIMDYYDAESEDDLPNLQEEMQIIIDTISDNMKKYGFNVGGNSANGLSFKTLPTIEGSHQIRISNVAPETLMEKPKYEQHERLPYLFNTESFKRDTHLNLAARLGSGLGDTYFHGVQGMGRTVRNVVELSNIRSNHINNTNNDFREDIGDISKRDSFSDLLSGLTPDKIDYIIDQAVNIDHAYAIRAFLINSEKMQQSIERTDSTMSTVGAFSKNIATQLIGDTPAGLSLNIGLKGASALFTKGRQFALLSPTNKASRTINNIAYGAAVSNPVEMAMVKFDPSYEEDFMNIFITNTLFDLAVSTPTSFFQNAIPSDYITITGKTYTSHLKNVKDKIDSKKGDFKLGEISKMTDEDISNIGEGDAVKMVKQIDYEASSIDAEVDINLNKMAKEAEMVDTLLRIDTKDFSGNELKLASDTLEVVENKIAEFVNKNPDDANYIKQIENFSVSDIRKSLTALMETFSETRKKIKVDSKSNYIKELHKSKFKKEGVGIDIRELDAMLFDMKNISNQIDLFNMILIRNQLENIMGNKTRNKTLSQYNRNDDISKTNPVMKKFVKEKRKEEFDAIIGEKGYKRFNSIDKAVDEGMKQSYNNVKNNVASVVGDNTILMDSVPSQNLTTLREVELELDNINNKIKSKERMLKKELDKMAENVNIQRRPKESIKAYRKRIQKAYEARHNKAKKDLDAKMAKIAKKNGC